MDPVQSSRGSLRAAARARRGVGSKVDTRSPRNSSTPQTSPAGVRARCPRTTHAPHARCNLSRGAPHYDTASSPPTQATCAAPAARRSEWIGARGPTRGRRVDSAPRLRRRPRSAAGASCACCRGGSRRAAAAARGPVRGGAHRGGALLAALDWRLDPFALLHVAVREHKLALAGRRLAALEQPLPPRGGPPSGVAPQRVRGRRERDCRGWLHGKAGGRVGRNLVAA